MCDSERPTHAQGGSFAYLTPAFAIIAQVKARGVWVDAADGTNHARFLVQTHCVNAISTMHTIVMAHWPVLGATHPGQVHSNAKFNCRYRTAPTTRTSWCKLGIVPAHLRSPLIGLKQSGKCT